MLLALAMATGCDHDALGTDPDSGTADAAPAVDHFEHSSHVCTEDGWCWVYPWPVGVPLYAAWVGTEGRRVVAGEAGVVALDDGSGWTGMMCGMPNDRVSGLWGPSLEELFAITWKRGVYRYDGTCWRHVGLDGPLVLEAIWGTSVDNLYVGGSVALYHFDGEGFTEQELGARDFNISAIGGSGPDDVYVSGYRNDEGFEGVSQPLYHFDGAAWAPRWPDRPVTAVSIWAASPGEVYFATHGGLLRSDGLTLETVCDGIMLSAVAGRGPTDVLAVGDSIVSFDGSQCAETPLEEPIEEGRWLHALAYIPEEPPLAAGDLGRIFSRDASGWHEETERLTDHELLGVWGSSWENVFAVGRQGTIVHADGQRWRVMDSGVRWDLTTVWGVRPDRVYAAGYRDEVLVYDGQRWAPLPARVPLPNPSPDPDAYPEDEGAGDPIRGLWGTAADDLYAVSGNRVYHYNGQRWRVSLEVDELGHSFTAIAGLEDPGGHDTVVVGGFRTVARHDGSGWQVPDLYEVNDHFGPREVLSIAVVDDAFWLVGANDMSSRAPISVSTANGWFTHEAPQGVTDLRAIWGSAPDDVFVLGGHVRTDLQRWDGIGFRAQRVPAKKPPIALWGHGRGHVIAVGDRRILRRAP